MFEIGFGVEVDPEFPAGGGEPPERIPPGLLRIGAVLRITPPGAEAWDIAVGTPSWWRTPVPTALAFISEWRGYVIDVVRREVLLDIGGVTRIREDQRNGLLLLATQSELTAMGVDGIVWATDRIVDEDLKVVAIDARGIVCTGDVGTTLPHQIVIDPLTGRVV
jgi:hypothetical protein